MTAVASSANLQSLPRHGWANGNGSQMSMSLNGVNSEELPRMLVPRKSAQRSNSSSSISTLSSTSAASTPSTIQANGLSNGEINWATRKKPPARGLWPSSKVDAVPSISTARPQSVGGGAAGSPATSPMTALHSPSLSAPPQQMSQSQWQQNGGSRNQGPPENPAILHLLPINGTFESKTITVPFAPDILRIGRQTNQKTIPTPLNGYFDSKVLSRQHAEIWAERDGKIWIRDVKSSNGTFVNGKRLSQENRDSEPHVLKEQDVLELGIDIVSEDQKTVVHHKVAARVEHAGIYGFENNALSVNLNDMDSPGTSGNMGQAGSLNGRSRTGSQGSATNGGRVGPGGGMMTHYTGVAAYHPKWLQPISMEQIVKRINVELRQARLQSSDLHHTGMFVDAVAADEVPPPIPPSQKPPSPTKSFSHYTSPPPAPPPSQPLPEAPPDAGLRSKLNGLPALQPLLRRSDTERPKTATPTSGRNSPTKSGSNLQIRSLVEALTTAQKEISSQGEKLKEVEEALKKERDDRKSAEERALRLESGTLSLPTQPSNAAQESAEQREVTMVTDVPRLQSLLDTMRAEMEDMKTHMERYRYRAESAEQESQRDRKTLAEMVEGIRRRDDALRRRAERRRTAAAATDGTLERPDYRGAQEHETGTDDVVNAELDDELERAISRLDVQSRSPGQYAQNGATVTPLSARQLQELGKAAVVSLLSPQTALDQASAAEEKEGAAVEASAASRQPLNLAQGTGRSRTQEQLVQSAPYVSLIGVVLLGVGMMAYLNGWQRVVERSSS